METAPADVADISWLNAFEVGEWGGFPRGRIRSGGIHKENPSNEPQSIPKVELGHLSEIGWLRVPMEMLPELTCCISPSAIA